MSKILLSVLSSRLLFLAFALLAVVLVPLNTGYIGQQSDPSAPYLAWVWANFDGRHFLDIATNGYQGTNFAYFPLYPASIWLLSHVFSISSLYLGILMSSLSLLASMFVLYKIVRLDYKNNIASLALLFLGLFPLSFFYHSVYPDSLFLLLSTTSFYFARKGSWALSGVFGALTVLTRLSGVALIPALALEWYLQNRKLGAKGLLAPFLTLLGLVIYMVYLNLNFGDPLLFQKSMSAWQQQNWVFPPQVIWRYIKIFWSVDKNLLIFWVAVLEFVSLFIYLALSVYVWRKIRASYGVFMLVLLLLITFTGTFAGTPRYMLHLFPGFIGMALLVSKNKKLRFIAVATFLILGVLLTALFTRGYFIA
ncbi:MAG: glycosyltransferase family 39 protein [bacterium]|nr:glycosyltransferase family 39 protein [bacterium]